MMPEQSEPDFKIIMTIDDNRIDLHITKFLIEKSNVAGNVLQYDSPIEALGFLQENQHQHDDIPEVILLDIHMPLMTGFDFLREFKRLPAKTKDKCHIFMVSSSLDEGDLQRVAEEKDLKIEFQEKPVTKNFLKSLKPKIKGSEE